MVIKSIIGAMCACLTVLSFVVTSANAEIIRHEFSGVITSVNFDGVDDPFGGQIQVGTPYNGYYEFDSEQLPDQGDACTAISSRCDWSYSIPPYSFNVDVAGVSIITPVDFVLVQRDDIPNTGQDNYVVSSMNKPGGVFDSTGWVDAVQIGMVDNTGTAITDPSILLLTPPNPEDYDFPDCHFVISGAPSGLMCGRIDSYLRAPVPTINVIGGQQQECAEPDGTTVEIEVDAGTMSLSSVTWEVDGSVIEGGASVTIFLGLGSHSIKANVIAYNGTTGSDEETVTVTDTAAPNISPAFVDAKTGNIVTSVKRKGNVAILDGVSDACDPLPVINSVVGLPAVEGEAIEVKSNKKDASISITSGPSVDTVILTVIATDASGNTATGSAALSVMP